MRKAKDQILKGESLFNTGSADEERSGSPNMTYSNNETEEEIEVAFSSRGRQRRKPTLHPDNIFSIFRSKMSEHETREGNAICPVCKEEIPKDVRFDEHIGGCAKQRESCKICKITFKRKEYLDRNKKIKHHEVTVNKCAKQTDQSSFESDGSYRFARGG